MPPNDPLEAFVHAANHSERSPLLIQATLQLMDEAGVPVDFITGDVFERVLEQVYRRVFGPIHAAHVERFDAIGDWTLSSVSIHALTAAIVDPFIDATMGGDARIFHVCCQALIQAQHPLPRELWWTPLFAGKLRTANPGFDAGNRSVKIVLAEINFACYHFCLNFMHRSDMPYREDDPVHPLAGYRRSLRRVAKGHLMMLLDELTNSPPEGF